MDGDHDLNLMIPRSAYRLLGEQFDILEAALEGIAAGKYDGSQFPQAMTPRQYYEACARDALQKARGLAKR